MSQTTQIPESNNIQLPTLSKNNSPVTFDLNAKNAGLRWNADGKYPYKKKMDVLEYERHKHELQIELLKMQGWVKETNQRIVILFEGRDAAGKGGTIKRFMEHLNPRGAHVIALESPMPGSVISGTSSAILNTSQPRGKSSSLTVPGITGQGLKK